MWHSLDIDDVLRKLGSSLDGLSEEEAKRRLGIYGKNEIREKSKILHYLKEIFLNFSVILFLIAAFLYFFTGEIYEGIIVIIILALYILFDIYNSWKAEKTLKSLKENLKRYVYVIRGGNRKKIDASELVPGDIVILSYGDVVPADLRIIEESGLLVDESNLTGESNLVKKFSRKLDLNTPIYERKNMLFMGSRIMDGICKAVVVETGNRTYFGELLMRSSIYETKSIIKREIDRVLKAVSLISAVIIISTIFFVWLFKFFDIENSIIFAISLALLSIPEGLPSALLIISFSAMTKLERKGILVRNPFIIENLGYIDYVVLDKTGTITYNTFDISYIYFNNKFYRKDDIKNNIKELDTILESIYNNSESKDVIDSSIRSFLLYLGYKKDLKKLKIVPFSSERKMSITIVNKDGEVIEFIKGAPEKILDLSELIYINGRYEDINYYREDLLKIIDEYSSKGYKVLGVSNKIGGKVVFQGLLIMENKIREGIEEYIKKVKEMGIDIIILSGDHKNAVESIGKRIGLGDKAILGAHIKNISDKELYEIIKKYKIFARVDPEDKLRVIEVLKKNGHKVAMIGDGINDSLAIKRSDIGVTFMDSTDAVKDIADIILVKGGFDSLAQAIIESRKTLYSLKVYINIVISTILGAFFAIVSAFYIFKRIFIEGIQILILNLTLETINAINVDKGEIYDENIYKKKIEKIFDKIGILRIIRNSIFLTTTGLTVAFSTFYSASSFMFYYLLASFILFTYYGMKYKVNFIRNKYFYVSILASIFIIGIFSIPPTNAFTKLYLPTTFDLSIILLLSIIFSLVKFSLYYIEK